MSQTKAQLIDNLVQPITGALGSESAPTFSFTADPNTGIYSPGADQLAISTGGSGRLFVDASGRLLVGTSSSSLNANLLVAGNSGAPTGPANFVLQRGSANPSSGLGLGGLYFADSNGGLGADVSAISEGTWTTGTSYPTRLVFSTTASGASTPTERLRITATGLVGIGVSAPGGILDVSGSSFVRFLNSTAPTLSNDTHAGEALFIRSGGSAGDGNVQAVLALGKADGASDRSGPSIGSVQTTADTDQVGLAFYTSGSTASSQTLSERVRITHAGNVGIGTASPAVNLEISRLGSTWSGSAPPAGTALFAHPGGGTSNSPTHLMLGAGNTAISAIYFGDTDSSSRGVVQYDHSVDALQLFSAGSERARIDSSGRLLVGTSSASTALGSLTAKLQVQGTSVFDTGITNTLWESSTNPSQLQLVKSRGASIGTHTVVQDNDNLGRILFGGSDGTDFETAAWIQAQVDGTPGNNDMPGRLVFSTTADGASSPTERMRIDSSGRVGIGTTSPTSTAGGLDIASGGLGLVIGADSGVSTRTDATQKNGRVVVPHYTNSEEPFGLLHAISASTFNSLALGGGTSLANAATDVICYTASNTTTVTGSERLRIDSSGRLLVGTSTAGSGGTLSVNGTTSVGGGSTGSQSSMSTVGMEQTSSVSTTAKTIFTSIIQSLSSAAVGHVIVYGHNNVSAGFLDVLVVVPSGTVTVLSSTSVAGSPAARTYTMSANALQLSMASGTYSTNVRCTSMGYPF